MFILDNTEYNTLEEASEATGIALSTLKNHINSTWKSRKGTIHTLKEKPQFWQHTYYKKRSPYGPRY